MREEEKISAGRLFLPSDAELKAMKVRAHDLSRAYNTLSETETEKRAAIIAELLGSFGEGSFLQGPITFHYGRHTHIGRRFYGNFNFTVQDDATVTIGDDCNFGPNVTIVTPVHPLLPDERRFLADETGTPRHVCYAKPVCIGHDCWFGACVTVCPGVTVGNNCVIGAGSVITRDIPDDSFAAGVPCRVIRRITAEDSMKYRPDILGDYHVIKPEEMPQTNS